MVRERISYALLILLVGLCTLTQAQPIKFHHINEGMSQRNVHCIEQDSLGFIWIATRNGLYKYNGAEFKVYQHNPKDSSSIDHNYVYKVFTDSKGKVWISTAAGINTYNPGLDNFETVPVSNEFHQQNEFSDIAEDDIGRFWFCSQNGLYLLDTNATVIQSRMFRDLPINSITLDSKNRLWLPTKSEIILLDLKRLKHRSVYLQDMGTQNLDFRAVVEDIDNHLWVASWNKGLYKVIEYEEGNEKLQPVEIPELPTTTCKTLLVDQHNALWIGTESYGLFRYDIDNNRLDHHYSQLIDPTSIASNGIWSLFEDRDGRIWIGFYDKGVDVIDPFRDKFRWHRNIPSNPNSLSANSVVAFEQAKDGDLLIASDGSGLNYWHRKSNTFTRHFFDPNQRGQGSNITFLGLTYTDDGSLWAGTWGEGLVKIDTSDFSVKKYKHRSQDQTSIASNMVFKVLEDPAHAGNFWVATWGEGIDYFDTDRAIFSHYKPEPSDPRKMHRSSLRNNEFFDMVADDRGRLWLAGSKGIERVEIKKNGKWDVRLYQNTNTELVLSDNIVPSLLIDGQGQLWACTYNGLDLYQEETDDFLHFTVESGLQGNIVADIQQEAEGVYWVSTDKGLNKLVFDPTRPTELLHIKHFDTDNGLQPGAFNERAGFVTEKGEILFGGLGGFNIFHPDSVFKNPLTPKVYFTGFKVFNQTIKPGDGSGFIDKDISMIDHITLNHKDNVFTLEFIGVAFTNAKKMSYAYKMEGFENQWNYVGNRHEATYTSLNPGRYTFKVKVANSDGLWAEDQAMINIEILPPWWQTWWFRVFAIVIVMTILTVVYRVRVSMLEKQKAELQRLVQERTEEVVQKNEKLLSHQKALEVAYEELARNNEEVRASIEYASYIQNAMLDSTTLLQESFPDSFILLKPRDVVSGDFYWFKKVRDKIVICASDCTGHGVPGALMSMLGMNLLNQIVANGTIDADEILDELHEGVYHSLSQGTTENRDGMDISLVVVDTKKQKLQFAGANNPLALVLDDGFELIKPDKKPIGGASPTKDGKRFSRKEVRYDNCDKAAIYLFSDGFQDQFGGDAGRKFMVRKFYKLLADSQKVPMTERGQFLDERLVEWQGDQEQVDDILVMGITLK